MTETPEARILRLVQGALTQAAHDHRLTAANRCYAKTSYKLLEKIDGSPREPEIIARRHAEIDAEIAEHFEIAAALDRLRESLTEIP